MKVFNHKVFPVLMLLALSELMDYHYLVVVGDRQRYEVSHRPLLERNEIPTNELSSQEPAHHHVPQHKDYRPDVSQPGEPQESEYDNEPDDDQGGEISFF